MIVKKGYYLHAVCDEYIILPVGEEIKDFSGFTRTNETGAFYWRELEKGITEEELLAKMLERFDDLDEETARADLREFLDSVAFALE